MVRAFVQVESWLHLCGEGRVAVAVGLHRGIHAIGKYIKDKKKKPGFSLSEKGITNTVWKGGKLECAL